MSNPLKDKLPRPVVVGGLATARDLAGCKEPSRNSKARGDSGFGLTSRKNGVNDTIRHRRTYSSRGRDAEEHNSTRSTSSSADPSIVVSTCSSTSFCAAEAESDADVVVYIDDAQDEDPCEAPLIAEYRISARKTAEIQAYKSKWVAQVLRKRDHLLGPAFSKVLAKDRSSSSNNRNNGSSSNINNSSNRSRNSNSKTKSSNSNSGAMAWGHTTNIESKVGCGIESLQRKIEAFAACMTPDALDLIYRNLNCWDEIPCDSSDSDSAERAESPSRPSRDLQVSSAPAGSASAIPMDPHGTKLMRRPQSQAPDSKAGEVKVCSSSAALDEWRCFLKYVRKTCKVLLPRQRIERHAGLESDDDDEQAPLYMCRPGSVQRPSPLIAHSLTQHLKASDTLFFKQFRRQCPAALPTSQWNAFAAAAPVQQEQPSAKQNGDSSALFRTAAGSISVSEVGSSPEEKDGNSADPKMLSTERTIRNAVPLYEITAETAQMFGDIMRLQDTARMLEASCTFRLAAAPSSKIHYNKWKPSASARMRESNSSSTLSHGLCSPDSAVQTATPGYPRCRGSARRAQYASHKHAANALKALCVSPRKTEAGISEAGNTGEDDSRVVYTIQADEDTLALSGLDPEYCARVEFASRALNGAVGDLAQLDLLQQNGGSSCQSAASVAHKRRRKTQGEDSVISSDSDSNGECVLLGEKVAGAACGADAGQEADLHRSLMADKLLLAHIMPYLPQSSPR